MANYLFRHKIISVLQKSDETAVNKFLLNKTFSIDVVCTYIIIWYVLVRIVFCLKVLAKLFLVSLRIKSFSLSQVKEQIAKKNSNSHSRIPISEFLLSNYTSYS